MTQTVPINLGGARRKSLHPWPTCDGSTNVWNCDAALFKSFAIRERVRLRLQATSLRVQRSATFLAGSDGV